MYQVANKLIASIKRFCHCNEEPKPPPPTDSDGHEIPPANLISPILDNTPVTKLMEQLEAESKDGKCHRDEFGRDGFIIYRPERKINPIFRKNERFCEIYAAVHPDKSQPQVWKQGILAQYGSNSASWGVICGVFEVIRKKSGGGMESSIQLAVYGDEFTSIHFINTYIDLRALKYFANDPLLAKGVSKLQNNFFCHSRGASIVGAPSVRESASRRKKPSRKAEAKDDDVTPLTVAAKPSKRLPKKKMVKKPEPKAKGKHLRRYTPEGGGHVSRRKDWMAYRS